MKERTHATHVKIHGLVSVCPPQAGVLSKRMERSRWYIHRRPYMAHFDLSIAFRWPCVDVPRLCSPVSSASVVLRMRQMYDVLLEEAFVFLMRKKTSRLNCSLCSECCLFEGRETSLRLTLTDFLGFPSADTVSVVASWYIMCRCSIFFRF